MGKFLDQIRRSKFVQPTQTGFSTELWNQSFETHKTDKCDEEIYKAGLWIFEKLNEIRDALGAVDLSGFSKEKVLRLLIGDLNRTCCSLSNEQITIKEGQQFIAEHAATAKIHRNTLGIPFTPDEAASISVDGARFPLARILSASGASKSLRELSDAEILHRQQAVMILAQCYDAYEDLWGECLWNGWVLNQTKEYDSIEPSEKRVALIRAVSNCRRESLMMQQVMIVINHWRYRINQATKLALSTRPNIQIIGAGKGREYKVANSAYNPDVPPKTLISRVLAEETYFEALLHESLPKLPGITLFTLLQVWEILYSLCEAHLQKFPSTGIKSANNLSEFAPTIKKQKLARLLSDSLPNFSLPEAIRVIDFLTYQPRFEIWSNPLIPLSENSLLLVFTDVLYANLLRNLELWMKRGGVDLTQKGPAFEKVCRDELAKALKASPQLKSGQVYPSKIVIQSGGTKEEIDLLIYLKNAILIAEVKCFIFPTKPIEIARYFETLREASAQIKRKAQTAKLCVQDILNRIGKTSNGDVKLVPFVLINQPLGAGFEIDDIPVVDRPILEVFLKDGCLSHFANYDENNEAANAQHTSILYHTEEEASQNIDKYLKNAPQIILLAQYGKNVHYPLFTRKKESRPGYVTRCEIKTPFEELQYENKELKRRG